MTTSPQTINNLQSYLISAQANFAKFCKSNGLANTFSLHISPDMCWVSLEHEYQVEFDSNGDKLEFINRLPVPCHTILTKL